MRIALIAASMAAAALYFLTDSAGSESWTGKILESLMFGFTPALFGLAFAGIAKLLRRTSGPEIFQKDTHRVWAVLIAILLIERFIAFWDQL